MSWDIKLTLQEKQDQELDKVFSFNNNDKDVNDSLIKNEGVSKKMP